MTIERRDIVEMLRGEGAIEVVNNMFSDQFYSNDLAIMRVTARFLSQALQHAEDITLMDGDQS